VPRSGTASDRQLALSLGNQGDESISGTRRGDAPVVQDNLLECVLEADNLRRALRQVRRNRGAPGIDGMTVEELPEHLKEHWPRLKETLLNGAYKPQPVRRVTIPKPGGGERQLGVPTVYSYCTSYSVF
jgi:RNA-directed DNA polymerase